MKNAAILLIGYQNDFFSQEGTLHKVIDDPSRLTDMVAKTVAFLEKLMDTPMLILNAPIAFASDYRELKDPVGLLKFIKDRGAFKMGTKGSETIPEIRQFGERIVEVPGKSYLNVFLNADMLLYLEKNGIENLVLMGATTSICIDPTAHAAFERGYHVTVLSDCTFGRSPFEHSFYCNEIFPQYSDVRTSEELAQAFGI